MRTGSARVSGARRGSAAVGVLVALVLLQLAVVGVVLAGGREHALTARRMETVRSFYAAEAGMNMAIRELSLNVDEDEDGVIGSISDDGDDSNDPILAGARVRVELSDSDDGSSLLASVGAQGEATRRIEASLVGTGGSGFSSGSAVTPGLSANWFYESRSIARLSDIDWDAPPDAVTVENPIDFANTGGSWPGQSVNDRFGVEFSGWIEIPAEGTWTFRLRSDDGSALWIDGVQIVNNDGLHSIRNRDGSADLTPGRHAIRVQFFENGGQAGLTLSWRGPGVSSLVVVPEDALWH